MSHECVGKVSFRDPLILWRDALLLYSRTLFGGTQLR